MKELPLLIWLTQLGLSVAAPLAGFILLALWLRNQFSLGNWVLWIGIVIGFISAVDGFCSSLKTLHRLTKDAQKEKDPPISFNDHN